MQHSRVLPLRIEKGEKECLDTRIQRSVLLFFVSYFVSRCGFCLDENSSVGLTEFCQSNWAPFGASSARHKEKKIRVAASDCTARALNDDARRYRGNFVTDNSHGDIIGPGPINGKLSSCSGSPRISSRRILDLYPYTHTSIANS